MIEYTVQLLLLTAPPITAHLWHFDPSFPIIAALQVVY